MAATCDTVTIDICRKRGDSYPIRFAIGWTDEDGIAPSIAGLTFTFTMDTSEDPTDGSGNLFQLSGIIIDPNAQIVEFHPTEANMDLSPDIYYYDVEFTDSNGYVRTPIDGSFTIDQDITK